MQLRIRYRVNYQPENGPVYSAICTVVWQDTVERLAPAIRAEKLETLAKQWWLQFGGGDPRTDGNLAFDQASPDWPSQTVGNLVNDAVSFSHPAALYVEAMVERLKRACWMIHIHSLHSDFFEKRAQQPKAEELIDVSLDPDKPQPLAQAFPGLSASALANP